MSHANARLNHYGRRLLITRVLEEGWTAAAAAEASGVSRATVYKWLARFRTEGPAGLSDRSSCPAHNPRHLSVRAEERILRLRQRRKLGPHRLAALLGVPRSTCYAVLRRHGLQRLDWMDRPSGEVIRRYERARPGELIHLDVKKLGRIPVGGGWRALGRQPGLHHVGAGYDPRALVSAWADASPTVDRDARLWLQPPGKSISSTTASFRNRTIRA